ncbi:MAG: DsrE family protein [Acholeplasmataceae bacterium]|nr:DsrE family protein [Acholeplasmataceae bacterium]
MYYDSCSYNDLKIHKRMIKAIIKKNGSVYLCGTCLDARSITYMMIIEGTIKNKMSQLSILTNKFD